LSNECALTCQFRHLLPAIRHLPLSILG